MSTIISFYLKDIERRTQDGNAYLTFIVPSYKADTVKEMITKAIDSMEKEEGKQFNEFTWKGYLGQILTDVNIPYCILPQRMVSGDNHIWQLALATKSYYFYQDTDCRDARSRFLMYDTRNSNDLAVTGALAADGYQKELFDVLADIKEAAYLTPELKEMLPDYKVAYQEEIQDRKKSYEAAEAAFYTGRFRFCDDNGHRLGIAYTDDLSEAVENAARYQCGILDRQAAESPILYSVWDGWNMDSDHYEELFQEVAGWER